MLMPEFEARRNTSEGLHLVGPILCSGPRAWAVIRAIENLNSRVEVTNRGSYLRVEVPDECRVTREEIENELGEKFCWFEDMEAIMVSFKGHMRVNAHEAIWSAPGKGKWI